jgi:cell wall-associated NlpC family hydrolase
MYYILTVMIVLVFFNGCSQKSIFYSTNFDTIKIEKVSTPDLNTSRFEKKYFEPWHYAQAPKKRSDIMWPYRSYTKGVTFGSNLQALDTNYFDTLKMESNFEAFDSIGASALTLQFSHLKNFPTHHPIFRDPQIAGEGFPFDYNQNSAIHANEPLYISHYSKTKAWVYVFTSYASGWLPSTSITMISNKHKELWEHAQQVRIIKDSIALYDTHNNFVLNARIGMLLPLIKEKSSSYKLLLAVAGGDLSTAFREVTVDKENATDTPLTFNATTVKTIGNQLINQNYGWGGLYEDRDCSSMLRDYFSVFGIWLPRNSFQQSLVGKVVSIKHMSEAQKIQKIKEEGVPFQTLLYKPGHIMLYLGVQEGEIFVFHNTWGIKTLYDGVEGRYIIGKSIISTLNLGSELIDYDSSNNLLEKLESFNIVSATP